MAKTSTSSKSRRQRKKRTEKNGDIIRIQNIGNSTAIAAGRESSASVTNAAMPPLLDWTDVVKKKIDLLPDVSPAQKEDIKEQVNKIDREAQKGSNAEIGRLEILINTLSVMAPDIFDVVIATLANPLAGIGLVLRKIGGKAKIAANK